VILSVPANILTALVWLGWVAAIFPRVMREIARHALVAAQRILGI
jgi:hypothetical protein